MKKLKRVQEVVQELNIIDDTLFQKMAEDIGFCEEMISTILGEEVTVKEVTPQYSIKNLQGRSVVLDEYEFEKFLEISGRKKQFKESERGQEEVCELVENYARECAEEAAKKATKTAEKNGVIRLFQNGASYEMARDAFPSFSDEELQRIYIEHKNK